MKNSVQLLLSEAKGVLSGYAAYLNYRFLNLGIKAEPASLLSVTVKINNTEMDLEEVADITRPNEQQFAIYPKKQVYLFAICKELNTVHPEFKLEQQEYDEEKQMVFCTMPDMNEDRHDACLNTVNVWVDETKTKMELTVANYTAKITQELRGETPETIDEAINELKEMHKQHIDTCKQYQDAVEKQIEEAYQQYLTGEQEKAQAEQEERAAHGSNTGFSMRMGEASED